VPIEIKELVIRAVVDAGTEQKPESAAASGQPLEDIVQACVEQVLEVLRRREER
jgi:hypothetical protein